MKIKSTKIFMENRWKLIYIFSFWLFILKGFEYFIEISNQKYK